LAGIVTIFIAIDKIKNPMDDFFDKKNNIMIKEKYK